MKVLYSGLKQHTVNAIEFIAVTKMANLLRKRLSPVVTGGQRAKLLAIGASSDGHNRLEMRVLALEFGKGMQSAFLAIDILD